MTSNVEKILQFVLKESTTQSKAKDVLLLNVFNPSASLTEETGDDSDVFFSKINGQARSIITVPVYRQLNESFNHALTRSVRGDISPETLVVCQVKGISTVEGGDEKKDILTQLGAFFASFVNNSGLLLLWQQHDESNLTPTDLVLELASSGLIPASGGNTPLHFFGPDTQFAAYFQKKSFLFRYPQCEDLERLCTIDKESWDEVLCYPNDIFKEWLNSKPQEIIVLVDGRSGDVVVALYS